MAMSNLSYFRLDIFSKDLQLKEKNYPIRDEITGRSWGSTDLRITSND
jgi:hypothetical protein